MDKKSLLYRHCVNSQKILGWAAIGLGVARCLSAQPKAYEDCGSPVRNDEVGVYRAWTYKVSFGYAKGILGIADPVRNDGVRLPAA